MENMGGRPPAVQARSRWRSLVNERESWIAHWRDITDYLLPVSGRYFAQDRNEGRRRHGSIIDNTGTRALHILAAGMMSGMTSPARPWFRLTTPDSGLDAFGPVKGWLHEVTRIMQEVFSRSNTYRALHMMYRELGAFGTAVSLVADDFDTVIHHHPLTVGEYAIATDWQGRVVTMYREFERTVSEVVKEFGLDACSRHVQEMYRNGNLDGWVGLTHAIEPRADRDPTKRDGMNKPWRSIYFETTNNDDRLLRESGFDEFPVLAPRWDVTGGNAYGYSPGMEALGDIKQLQHEQLRKANGIDYMTNPPLQAPASLKNRDIERLPGGLTFYDQAGPSQGVRSLFEVNLNLQHLLEDIRDVRSRVNGSFYADMFLMLAGNGSEGRMTATEVAERHEEKLLMLGPVVERLNNELLSPLVESTFQRMVRVGIIPPPPPELHGMPMNVEFVSMLAQAQRAIGVNGIDRFVGNIGAIAQFKPDVLDKFDADKWAEAYADKLGIDPELIVPGNAVALIRKQRAQAQQQAQAAAMVEQQANAAAKLGTVSTQGGLSNAANDIIGNLSGYTSPSPELVS